MILHLRCHLKIRCKIVGVVKVCTTNEFGETTANRGWIDVCYLLCVFIAVQIYVILAFSNFTASIFHELIRHLQNQALLIKKKKQERKEKRHDWRVKCESLGYCGMKLGLFLVSANKGKPLFSENCLQISGRFIFSFRKND